MKVKNKKTTFAYEEYHPEDGPFCWNRINEEIMHDHHSWQMKRPKYIPVVSRQNGKSIINLYLAATVKLWSAMETQECPNSTTTITRPFPHLEVTEGKIV